MVQVQLINMLTGIAKKANLHGMLLLHLTGYHQITLLCIRADIQGLCLILIPDGLFD